ncbi:MAG: ABC transporter ATP-binding protein [Candidatus Omnitrophica bacterium]|nr:ABC transporter ATP-binding protein [Candidatus Omnitrophota bacterium]MBU4589825.1 ABC transporter ATP-binding protein [Candidatus Omnitrophota bacterium]
MLRAEGIHKIYRDGKRDLQVLKGIDIEVAKGEAVAVQGPSGAGKSTLLHILGGIDRPTSGKVFLENKDFYSLRDGERAGLRNRKIGFVFQFYHLLPEFTALENAIMPALIAGQDSEKKAEALLRDFGLGNRLRHRPAELSGGEQQRVAIARALINNPDMLLCDEPTGNLDSKIGGEILDILFRLKTTLVIVTHDRELAKRANRVLEIRDGRMR